MKIKNYIILCVFCSFFNATALALNEDSTSSNSTIAKHLNTELQSIINTDKLEDDFPELFDVEPIESDLNSAKDVESIAKRHKYNQIQEDLEKRKKIEKFLSLNYKTQDKRELINQNSYDKNNIHLPKKSDYQSEAFNAVKEGNIEGLKILLPYVDSTKLNKDGKSLLDIAAENNYNDIINLLISKHVHNNSKNR